MVQAALHVIAGITKIVQIHVHHAAVDAALAGVVQVVQIAIADIIYTVVIV